MSSKWKAAGGRLAAWKLLEGHWLGLGHAPLDATKQDLAWHVLCLVYDGLEGFVTRRAAKQAVRRVLAGGLGVRDEGCARAAVALSALLWRVARWLLQNDGAPSGPDPVLTPPVILAHIEAAVAAVRGAHGRIDVLRPPHMAAGRLIGPLWHGGDEIWAAAAALIGRAQRSVQIQTWAYFRRAEAAKFIMGALAQRLQEQSRRRDAGEPVQPIDVMLIAGYFDDDVGLVHHNGGWSSSATPPHPGAMSTRPSSGPDSPGATTAAAWSTTCRVFPFPIDPALMRVRTVGQNSSARGGSRHKCVIVDATWALMSTASVQGSHHRVSSHGAPLHDLGWIVEGPVVREVLQPLVSAEARRYASMADNARAGPCPTADLVRALAQSAPAHIPQSRTRRDASVWRAKRAALWRALAQSGSGQDAGGASVPQANLVVLEQAPRRLPFSTGQHTAYQKGILAAVHNARRGIDINHCNIDAAPIVVALKRALERGVHVRLLAAEGLSDGIGRAHRLRRQHIYDLLLSFKKRSGAPGHIGLRWQRHAYFGHNFRNSHAKSIFIDAKLALIGSTQVDETAWRYLGQLTLAVAEPAEVRRLHRALFLGFWDAASRRLEDGPPHEAMRSESAEGGTRQGLGHPGGREQGSEDDGARSPESAIPVPRLRSVPIRRLLGKQLAKNGSMAALAHVRAPGRLVDAAFQRALASLDPRVKARYLRHFNRYFAPRIVTEEAALERLAVKHIRLWLPPNAHFAAFIQRNVLHASCRDYARLYRVAETLVDEHEGLRAYLLCAVAQDAPAHIDSARVIIAYEGTTIRKDALRQLQRHPTGRRAATDPMGLGFRAFARSRTRLLAWSDAALAARHPLTLTGFSLGGVQATRHWQALPPWQRQLTRLITFAMPGLDEATATSMHGPAIKDNVRHFRVRLDPFSAVGAVRPPGRVLRYGGRRPYPSLANHTYAYLSEREIDGLTLDLAIDTGQDEDPLSPRLDQLRRFWGLLRPAR